MGLLAYEGGVSGSEGDDGKRRMGGDRGGSLGGMLPVIYLRIAYLVTCLFR